MTRQNAERTRPGGLWLLLVPVTCCGGPLLVAALATAGGDGGSFLGFGCRCCEAPVGDTMLISGPGTAAVPARASFHRVAVPISPMNLL